MIQGRKLQYSYDNAGNQITRTVPNAPDKGWTLTWDLENRLTQMEKTRGANRETVSFKYDPFGRRIEKQYTTVMNGITKASVWTYLYDGDSVVLEIYTNENNVTEKTWYTHGAGTDEHLAMERSGQSYFFHQDGLGSVTSITNSSVAVVQTYEYDSFGMPKPSTNFRNMYQFAGRPWDREIGLYYNDARYYDPMEGRFVSRDPISFAEGDVNLYGYVQNNPINFIDPKGLTAEVIIWQPVGWGGSSFGHVSTNINGTTYSYGPQGMSVMPTADYLSRNSFRDGVGAVLNLTPSQEASVQACLNESQGSYSSVNNNCGSPIQRCLNRLGITSFRDLLPVSFGNSLSDSGLVSGYNLYNAVRPGNGSSAPWAR